MTQYPGREIKTVRKRLKSGERGGTPADRELLLEFSDRLKLLAEEYTDNRHIKLLRHLTRISEHVDTDAPNGVLTDALHDRDVAEDVVRWIHDNYENPETNRDYRVSLRVLGKRTADHTDSETDDNGYPVSVAWISANTPRSYDPAPNPAEILTWDEADAMTDTANNTRDAAMVQLLMDSGLRGSEFFDLKIEDISDGDHGLQLWVDGKTGERSVTLIPSVPYVNRWLTEHPGGESDYLWTKLDEPDRVSRTLIYKSLKRMARRAGIDKDATPTAFRKANATWLAKTGANAALIERRQGRKPGSQAVARYVAEFGEKSEESAYAQLHGRKVETTDEPEQRDVVNCPRCDRENPPTEALCMWCGQGLDPTGVEEADATERRIREALKLLAQKDPEKAERFIEAMDIVDSTPELRAAFRTAQ